MLANFISAGGRIAQAPPSGELGHIALPCVALLVWAGWDRTDRLPAVGTSTHSLNSHHSPVGALLMITFVLGSVRGMGWPRAMRSQD